MKKIEKYSALLFLVLLMNGCSGGGDDKTSTPETQSIQKEIDENTFSNIAKQDEGEEDTSTQKSSDENEVQTNTSTSITTTTSSTSTAEIDEAPSSTTEVDDTTQQPSSIPFPTLPTNIDLAPKYIPPQ